MNWPKHDWHDCKRDGHVYGANPDRCLVCDGGLGGCVVCGQWEGMIVDYDRCPGVKPDTFDAMNTLLLYDDVAPVFRPATADDLHAGKYVVVFDGGAWQYPGKIVKVESDGRYRVAMLYDGSPSTLELLALEWAPGEPAIGVYDPGHATEALVRARVQTRTEKEDK